MIGILEEFLTSRFVLPRYSLQVQSTGTGFVHTAPHTWEFANLSQPQSIRRLNLDGTLDIGLYRSTLNDCLAEYEFSSQDRSWYSVADWLIGTFEEINMRIREQPYGLWGYYAMASPTSDLDERFSVTAQLLFVLPVSSTSTSVAQASRSGILMGFIREAARFSDARILKIQDVPNFQKYLDGRVANEVYAITCNLEFKMNYQTSREYAL